MQDCIIHCTLAEFSDEPFFILLTNNICLAKLVWLHFSTISNYKITIISPFPNRFQSSIPAILRVFKAFHSGNNIIVYIQCKMWPPNIKVHPYFLQNIVHNIIFYNGLENKICQSVIKFQRYVADICGINTFKPLDCINKCSIDQYGCFDVL